jgi:DNA-binding NtrC family response regulator
MKILFVDDDLQILTCLIEVFKYKGHEVDGCQNPLDALEAAANEKYDVLVSDYRMPEIDGMELAQRFHQISPDTKIFLISGIGQLDVDKVYKSKSVYGFITKPFDINKLLAFINEMERCAVT